MNKKIIIGVLVVCLLAFVAVMAFSQNSPSVRWEYTTLMLRPDDSRFIQEMNRLGQEGWELVSTPHFGSQIFKRRLP